MALSHILTISDHTTVMHACDRTAQLIDEDAQLQMLWEELNAKLDEHCDSPIDAAAHAATEENLSVACHSRS